MRSVLRFLKKSDGVTTLEWVAISAIVLFAAIAITSVLTGGANELGCSMADKMYSEAGTNNPSQSCQ